MDEACLATYLAESMFVPSILLQDYISFEEISDYEVKAIIRHGGQTASGIFALMSSMNLFLLQQMTERCPIRMDPWNISHGRRFVVNIVFLKMELST